jgi:hypothetical protein
MKRLFVVLWVLAAVVAVWPDRAEARGVVRQPIRGGKLKRVTSPASRKRLKAAAEKYITQELGKVTAEDEAEEARLTKALAKERAALGAAFKKQGGLVEYQAARKKIFQAGARAAAKAGRNPEAARKALEAHNKELRTLGERYRALRAGAFRTARINPRTTGTMMTRLLGGRKPVILTPQTLLAVGFLGPSDPEPKPDLIQISFTKPYADAYVRHVYENASVQSARASVNRMGGVKVWAQVWNPLIGQEQMTYASGKMMDYVTVPAGYTKLTVRGKLRTLHMRVNGDASVFYGTSARIRVWAGMIGPERWSARRTVLSCSTQAPCGGCEKTGGGTYYIEVTRTIPNTGGEYAVWCGVSCRAKAGGFAEADAEARDCTVEKIEVSISK